MVKLFSLYEPRYSGHRYSNYKGGKYKFLMWVTKCDKPLLAMVREVAMSRFQRRAIQDEIES